MTDFLQETTYRAKDNKITHTQILETKDGPIIKPNAEENWEGNLIQIPKNCNAMLGNSKLVEIRYRFLVSRFNCNFNNYILIKSICSKELNCFLLIQIEMDIPGPHMNLEGEIPIIIIATAASDGLDWYPVVPEKPLENGGNENTSWIPPIPTPAENDETVEDKPEITPSASGQPELNPPGDKPKPEHDPSQPGIASDTKPDAENASSQPAISREPELNPSQPTIKPEDEPTPPNIERENKPTNKPEVKPTIEPEGKPTQPTYEPEFKPTPPNIQPENKPTIKPEDTPTQSNIKTNDRTTQSVIKAHDKPTEPTIEPKGKATQPTIKPVDTPLQPNKTNDRRTQPNIPVSPEVEPNKAYIPKDLEDNPLQPSMPREPKNKPKQPKVALEPEDSPGEPSMPEKPENNPRQPKVPLEYEDDPSAPSILRKPGNRPRQPKVSLEPEDNIRQSIVEEPELDQSTNDDTPNLMSPEPPVGNNENMAGNEVTKTSDDANTNISITELPSKTTTNNSETKGKPEETIPEDVPNKRHSRSKFRDRNQRAHTTINVFRPDQPPKQILPVPKPETWTKPINIPKIKPTEHTSQDNAHNKKTTDLPKQNQKSEYPSPKLTSESDQYCGIIQKSKPQKVKDISYSKTSCKKSGEPINTTKSKKQLPYPTFIEHQKIPKPVRKCLVNIFKVAENKILEPIGWTIKRNSCDLDDKDCKGPICLPQPSVRWSQDQG